MYWNYIRALEANPYVSLSIEHHTRHDRPRESSPRNGKRDSHSRTTFSDLFSSGNECSGHTWTRVIFRVVIKSCAPRRSLTLRRSRLINKLHRFTYINRIHGYFGPMVNVGSMFPTIHARVSTFQFPGTDSDWSRREALIVKEWKVSMKEVKWKIDSIAHKNISTEHMLPPALISLNTIWHSNMIK